MQNTRTFTPLNHWDKQGVGWFLLGITWHMFSKKTVQFLRKPWVGFSLPEGFEQCKYCIEVTNAHVLHCLLFSVSLWICVDNEKKESFFRKNRRCECAHFYPDLHKHTMLVGIIFKFCLLCSPLKS